MDGRDSGGARVGHYGAAIARGLAERRPGSGGLRQAQDHFADSGDHLGSRPDELSGMGAGGIYFWDSNFRQTVGDLVYAGGGLGICDPDVYVRGALSLAQSAALPSGHVRHAAAGSLDRARFRNRTNPVRSRNIWVVVGAALVRGAAANRSFIAVPGWSVA